ncbi:MAG: hypothetical protein FWE76_03215 [Symbiobacteriaceae bacterium]|nr:hypothetical protein [Symbiobacteriaceae bacterium]
MMSEMQSNPDKERASSDREDESKVEEQVRNMGTLGLGGVFDTSHNMGLYGMDELPVERREFLLNYAAEKITKAGMSVPAVMALEMIRPLSFIGSQMVWGAGPLAAVFINDRYISEIALLLEDRSNLEELCIRIEAIETVKKAEEKLARQEAARKKAQAIEDALARGEKPKPWWRFW